MKKILVIDDSETNLVLLKAILEDAGFEAMLANNSKEAKTIYSKSKPDLILLDLLMPGIDGFGFLRQLRKEHNDTLEIPIVVVTAYANSENTQKAKELGACDVIEKPIDIPEFLFKINQVLDSKIYNS
jgi:CheY-like chemotaxis protein